jgi:hypothetical protein
MFFARRSRAERDRGEIRLRNVDRLFGRSRPENRKLGHICCSDKVHNIKQSFFPQTKLWQAGGFFLKLLQKVNFDPISFG